MVPSGLRSEILLTTIIEGWPSALKNINYALVNRYTLKRPTLICKLAVLKPSNDNLIRVGHNSNIRIVRHDNHLSSRPSFLDCWYQEFLNRLIVEILIGLIQKDRTITAVHQQVEHQQKRTTLSRRKPIDMGYHYS